MRSIREVAQEILLKEEQWAANPSEVWGLSTGFVSLDKITGGLHAGEETVLGAETSHGKTAAGLQITVSAANYIIRRHKHFEEPRKRIIVFSPEMTDEALVMRLVSSRTAVSSRRIRKGEATPEDRQKWRGAMERVQQYDPFVTFRAGMSIDVTDIIADVNEAKHADPSKPIALIVVDYLQRVNGKGSSPYERANDVSRRLKDLTNMMNVPVLVLSQVKRPDTKPGQEPQRPTMYNLKDSGNIENDADNVFMLWRPPRRDQEELASGRAAMMWVDKNRNGPMGYFSLGYNPSLTLFTDMNDAVIDGE